MKLNPKKIIIYLVAVIFVSIIGYLGLGVYDYIGWQKAKQAMASGSCPWLCGAYQVMSVQPGCTESAEGCTCNLCNQLCTESTQVMFAGQDNCGVNFACVGPEVIPEGDGMLTSKQMMFCGTSNSITGNGKVATQSSAANTIERIIALFNKVSNRIKI